MDRLLNDLEPAAHVVLIVVAVVVSWAYWHSEEPEASDAAPTLHVDSSKVLRA